MTKYPRKSILRSERFHLARYVRHGEEIMEARLCSHLVQSGSRERRILVVMEPFPFPLLLTPDPSLWMVPIHIQNGSFFLRQTLWKLPQRQKRKPVSLWFQILPIWQFTVRLGVTKLPQFPQERRQGPIGRKCEQCVSVLPSLLRTSGWLIASSCW